MKFEVMYYRAILADIVHRLLDLAEVYDEGSIELKAYDDVINYTQTLLDNTLEDA